MKLPLLIFFAAAMQAALFGQIKEISKKTNALGETESYAYSFTSSVHDTITIKIVDPRGELLDVLFQNKEIAMNESINFHLRTAYWRQGEYQIIVESKKKGTVTKGLRMHPKGIRKK